MSAAWLQRHGWWLLVGGVGFATAFYRLDARGLWGDEVWNALWSWQQSPLETVLRFRQPPDFPLQFLLTKLTTWHVENEWTVRLPSAALGAASVLLLFSFARMNFSVATAVAAALLLAVAPYHVWYSQEARPYAAQACLSLLTLVFVCRWLRAPSWRVALGLTLSTALNFYNQFFALMPLAAEALGVTLICGWWFGSGAGERRRRAARQYAGYLACMTAAALAILPLLPGYVNYITSRGPGEVEAPPFIVTFEFLRSLFGLLGAGPDWTFWLFGAMFVVGVIAAIAQRNRIAVLLVLWLVLPFIVLWVAEPRHIFISRYFLFLQPVYLLLVGHGLIVVTGAVAGCWRRVSGSSHSESTRLRKVLQVATVGGVIAVTLVPTRAGYFVEKRNDWSSVCAYLKPRLQPGDAVTGDAYVVGLMVWCLRSHTGALVVDPVVDSPAQLALRGVNIWYVHIDPEAKVDWVVQHAIPVAKRDWARAGLADFNAFPFPQAEHPTTLYYYSPTEVPADVRFRQVRGSGGTPDYAQVVPRQRYGVRLGLKALRPRMLRVTFFDLKGRDLEVFVNGRNLLNIEAGKSGGQWVPVDIALPADLPDVVLVEFRNPGRETSAVSEVQLVYVSGSH